MSSICLIKKLVSLNVFYILSLFQLFFINVCHHIQLLRLNFQLVRLNVNLSSFYFRRHHFFLVTNLLLLITNLMIKLVSSNLLHEILKQTQTKIQQIGVEIGQSSNS